MKMRHLPQRNSSAALMMAMTCAPDEADRRPPIMVPNPDMMFEGAKEDGLTVELQHEALVFTMPAKDIAHVAALSAQPDVKPRSKRGQRVRRWR